jgi:hypothetical protein
LQETVGRATSNDDAAEPDVNRCHFCGLLCLFVDAAVHYAKDELDDHCDYYDDAEHLMARVKFLALRRVLAQSSGFCED